MANVKFYRGDKKGYAFLSATDKANAIYFAVDTKELIHNGIAYGRDTNMEEIFEVLEGQRDEIRNHDTEIDAINTSVDGLTGVVSGIKTTVSAHTTNINKLTKTTIPAILQDLDSLRQQMQSAKDEFESQLGNVVDIASRYDFIWSMQQALNIESDGRMLTVTPEQIDTLFEEGNGKVEVVTADGDGNTIPVATIKVSRIISDDAPMRFINIESIYNTTVDENGFYFDLEQIMYSMVYGFAKQEIGADTFNEFG